MRPAKSEESEPALILVISSFFGQKVVKAGKLSIPCVWWGAITWVYIRSPQNQSLTLGRALTVKNKSSTFVLRGRVKCVYYWCFNKVPVNFWLNFKLKKEQQIAIESRLMIWNILVLLQPHMARVKHYKCTWWQADNETTKAFTDFIPASSKTR